MFLNRIYKRLPLAWKLILTTTLPFFLLFVTLVFLVPYQMDQISLQSIEESLKLAIDDTATHYHNQAAISEPTRLNTQVVVYDEYFNALRYYNYSYVVDAPESIEQLEMRETPDNVFKVAEYTKEITIDEKTLYFQATKNIDYRSDFVRYSKMITIALFCIAVTLVFITSLISVKRNLRVLKNIAETAESITISNLSSSLPYEQSNDEIGSMVQSFNRMVGRLNEAVSRQNRFLSDVSHEIKTPIAVIKGYVNIIRRWGYKDPEVFNEAVAAIDSSVNDITDIINNLLLLDNLQNNRIASEFTTIDIATLVDKSVQVVHTLHPDRTVTVTHSRQKTVVCNGKLIAQVVRILIDNSLKYSPNGSPIELSWEIDSRRCIIRVCDYGEGIAKAEIPKVFDRFYRVEKSRSKETGGSGLGLSIASDIMKLHGGQITLTNRKPHGLCAEIQFPSTLSRSEETAAPKPPSPANADAESRTSNNQEV